MQSSNHILIQDIGKAANKFVDKVPQFFNIKRTSSVKTAVPVVKPSDASVKVQPKLVDSPTDRVVPFSESNRNKGRISIDYRMIREALTTKDIAQVAVNYKVEQSHILLIIQQGLRSLSLRFGHVAGRDLLVEPLRFSSFWLPIVEAYLYEEELFSSDTPESKILQLFSIIHKDKRHALLGKLQEIYPN